MKQNILIIGIGNILLKDEGVGIHIIRRIQAEIDSTPQKSTPTFFSWADTELVEGGTSMLDILEQISGRKKVIIIDSIQSNDPPGTIYRFSLKELPLFKPENNLSIHHVNLLDLLYLTSFLAISLPEIVIIGVNVKEVEMGESLSSEIENKLSSIIEIISKECLCFTES